MNLRIDTGLKEINFTGPDEEVIATVRFNPTDADFLERLYTAFAKLGEKDEKRTELIEEAEKENASFERIFEIAREYDTDMRKTIDGVLGDGLCKAIYGNINVYARNSEQTPLWADLLLTIIGMTEVEMDKPMSDPRLEKYTKKFGKKAG